VLTLVDIFAATGTRLTRIGDWDAPGCTSAYAMLRCNNSSDADQRSQMNRDDLSAKFVN